MRLPISETETFGSYLNSLMRRRNIKSDEQIARKAMRLQTVGSDRINVQRRTINNWRNNKNYPRSMKDRQFCLVLDALEATDQERLKLEQFLVDHTETTRASPPPKWLTLFQAHPWIVIFTISLLAGGTVAVGYQIANTANSPNGPAETLSQIPQEMLALSTSGFVLPQSNVVRIDVSQLEKLNSWELYVARNEIYARHGRQFTKETSKCLQNHFMRYEKTNEKGWYQRTESDIFLNETERFNAIQIRNYECNKRGGQINCTGNLSACN